MFNCTSDEEYSKVLKKAKKKIGERRLVTGWGGWSRYFLKLFPSEALGCTTTIKSKLLFVFFFYEFVWV